MTVMQMDSAGRDAAGNDKISDELFAVTLEQASIRYESTPEVYCPYLKDKVHLNRKGFEHIKLKAWNKARRREDQFQRLRLLHLMPEVLQKSHTVQGIWHTHDWQRVKSRGSWIKLLKNVSYYEFVAVLGKIRLKVVVKEIKGGAKFFWTIIPFWKMNPVANKRVLHEGNPETD